MRPTINQRELRNDSGAVLRRVEAGESITVTRHGTPVADLVPHRARQTGRRWVPAEEVLAAMRDLPPWHAEEFSRELDELAALVDDEQDDPWT